jgi:hypothetical protein
MPKAKYEPIQSKSPFNSLIPYIYLVQLSNVDHNGWMIWFLFP